MGYSVVIQLYQFIVNYTADRHLYGHLKQSLIYMNERLAFS